MKHCIECGHSNGHHSTGCPEAASEPDEPEDQSDANDVICPHCGNSYQAESEDFSENEREETCDACGKSYTLYQEFNVTHHTRATP